MPTRAAEEGHRECSVAPQQETDSKKGAPAEPGDGKKATAGEDLGPLGSSTPTFSNLPFNLFETPSLS